MKAIVIHAPHDLRIEDRPEESPGPGQVRVRVSTGGICGSDLHYYHDGGFGTVRIREPMIIGHEVAGHVTELGSGVTGLKLGDLVAVSPSRPCRTCRYCLEGKPNQCLNMRFYGSAMPFPHIQGAFRQELIADALQCAPADRLSPAEAAMAEPLSVALHAAGQAGEMLGRRVLVTGCGPIGLLAVLVARRAGAKQIVATDLSDFAVDMARSNGADLAVNIGRGPRGLADFEADKGHFDVLIECSGAEAALAGAIPVVRPGGIVVQLGLGGDMRVPMQAITAKELELHGSFRFHAEFFTAVEMMRKGLIDVKPLITQTVPLDRAEDGFIIASDRNRAMKAQIAF